MNIKRCFQPIARPTSASLALLLLRVVAGLAFVLHGSGKIQNPFGWMGPQAPVPGFFQFLAAISEFGGGLAWIFGLLTPLASLGIVCTMLVAVSTHMMVMKDPFVNQSGGGSYELASVYLCIAIVMIVVGPGKFALDRLVFKQRA